MNYKNQKAFVSLLGLLLAIAIIVFIGYKMYGVYLNKSTPDAQTKKALADQNIDMSNQMGAFGGAKTKIRDVNKILQDQSDQMMDATK